MSNDSGVGHDTRPVDREYLDARLETVNEQISHLATREDLERLRTELVKVELRLMRAISIGFGTLGAGVIATFVGVLVK